MNSLRFLPHSSLVLGLAISALTTIGCADHERVVVRERPVVVAPPPPPPPVVREQVIVRP